MLKHILYMLSRKKLKIPSFLGLVIKIRGFAGTKILKFYFQNLISQQKNYKKCQRSKKFLLKIEQCYCNFLFILP